MVVVILLLVLGAGEAQGRESSTTVAVNIQESIAVVSWPQEFLNLGGGLVPGGEVTSPELILTVKANSPWGIAISCDLPNGRMQEFDEVTGAYVPDGRILTNPLQWSVGKNGPWQALSSSGSSLAASQPPTGDAGQEVRFFLRYEASYSDLPVGPGRDYRMTLHYTAGLSY